VSVVEINGKVDILPISEIDYCEFREGLPSICGYEAKKWVQEEYEYQKSKPLSGPAHSRQKNEEEVGRDGYTRLQTVRMSGLRPGLISV